ncbi:Cof-type HAD-IIB family hydrolase [Enterococcus sp. AZ007]|uniref:Cof-type HAD-IIB family hydrolase n=2 Tax=Candidatus Enterococcus murrayae TaxID=2815321 RepID=A0ABS3HMC3_9ENTE|nr:Cof-type HAD-IIB family hydrolase [Enterococcus sp. MJM16]
MNDYRVAFFDIDGTLVDNQLPHHLPFLDRIPESAKQALKQLKENNIEPVIASGRHHRIIDEFASTLGVDSIISSNGNCVHYRGEMIHQTTMSPILVKELLDHLRERQIECLIETPQNLFCFESNKYMGQQIVKDNILKEEDPLPENIVQLLVPWNETIDYQLDPDSILVAEKVAPVAASIHLRTGTKAAGVQKICNTMNVSLDQALAFGDEENDFTMFETVGFPVAMGNATPALKEKASHITSAVSDDGIWKACIELGLIINKRD